MPFPAHVFREYDVRGVADRDLSDAFAHALGRAFAAILSTRRAEDAGRSGERLTIAVGRDGRLSSPRLFEGLVRGLVAGGAHVVEIGVGPTPLLYFAAHHLESDGAIQITGSHNPGEDNGFKMMRGKASFYGADIQELRRVMESELANVPGGEVTTRDVSDAYVAAVRAASRLDPATTPKVVVDAGNGAAGPLGVRTLEALGVKVDPLFCDIDGTFPNHHPDPTMPENLADLEARVKETGAALGIAWDGDGDRIGAMDEKGNVIWGDKLMILFSRALLAEHPGATILGEVKCSETLFADVTKHGGRALYSKTGHSLIKSKMKAEGALLAGEMSGHMFFADRYFGYDDAIYAAVRLLEIVAREGKPVSALLADVPETHATPELRFPCADEKKFAIVERVTAHYKRTHRVLDLDGARIDFGDGAWGLCRASNTQPVLVLRFEARSPARRDEIRHQVEAFVEETARSL
jgi:phosphomannomutase/phosphoglucomutase